MWFPDVVSVLWGGRQQPLTCSDPIVDLYGPMAESPTEQEGGQINPLQIWPVTENL